MLVSLLSGLTFLLAANVVSSGTVLKKHDEIPSRGRGEYPEQAYGYVDVREGAHMFYWFYKSQNSDLDESETPVVIWLQGGPGAGGSGYGNFGELGPLDEYLNDREYSWLKKVHLLFIDNPVGAGYSYVDNLNLLTTDIDQIGDDLLACLTHLTENELSFITSLPLWIFSESYGGKMTAFFGNDRLAPAIQSGNISVAFEGVVLGDSWISGVSYTNTWPAYLKAFTLLSDIQYDALEDIAAQIRDDISKGEWKTATNDWGSMETAIENYTSNADFYNVLLFDNSASTLRGQQYRPGVAANVQHRAKHHMLDRIEPHLLRRSHERRKRFGKGADEPAYKDGVIATEMVNDRQISSIMNGQIKEQLSSVVPSHVRWGGQSNAVFLAQEGDFMKPVVDSVDGLLNKGYRVVVENGQVDLICCTLGTQEWMSQMNWQYLTQFQANTKEPYFQTDLSGNYDIGYFKQTYRNLAMYYIMKAGHMVPADNPDAAFAMLQDIVFGD